MSVLQPDTVERLLIRGTNWVGDAVMSIPALREIRKLFKRARISLLVRPWVRDVYSAVDFVDEVIEIDRHGSHRGLIGLRRMSQELQKRDFQVAILLQNAFEAAFISWSARIPIRLGYPTDGRRIFLTHAVPLDAKVRGVHQAFYYLAILSGAGLLQARPWEVTDYPLSIRIGIRAEDRASARALLQSHGISESDLIIGVNPGAAYGPAKRWLSDRYAQVADTLAARHSARVLIFGSDMERQVAGEVAANMRMRPVVLAGQTSLGQLMSLIGECALFITNDSGPMHLAAALGVPQVAVFGSTSDVATGPLDPSARIVRETVDCSPCFLRECPIDFRCMTRISVAHVVEIAEEVLSLRGLG